MIKKISAIILALVLCLSVVVVPASSLELGDAQLAFELKWDKEYYSAGDRAVLSVYMDAADDLSLYTGSFAIGLNSAVISQEDNDIDTVKANSVTNDPFGTLYKPAESNLSWLAATVSPKVDAANTAEEQALYDHYLKFTAAKNASGSHENAANNKDGFYGSDFDPSEPIMQITFKVAAGVADGTPINAAITSGTTTCTPTQTAWKYYKTPGTGSTTANIAAADIDVTQAVATATVGEATTPELTIDDWKEQINFDLDGNGFYEGAFAIRQFVEFTNLLDVFGSADEAKDASDNNGLTEVGFVYATTADYDAKEAEAVIEAGASSGAYTLDNRAYVSTSAKSGSFVMGYTVKNVKDASVSLTILAYAKYMVDGEEKIATHEIVGNYSEIYNKNVSKIPPVKA